MNFCKLRTVLLVMVVVAMQIVSLSAQTVDEPAYIRLACDNLVITQYGNSDKNERSKLCVADRIVKWNGIELSNNRDLVANWIKTKAGEVTQVTVERDFGSNDQPQRETLVVELTHVGASTLFKDCLAGGRTSYRAPTEINPKLEALEPSNLQTEVENALGESAADAIGELSNAFRRFTDDVKGHYRNDQVTYLLNRPFRAESWGRILTDRLVSAQSLSVRAAILWRMADPQSRGLPDVIPEVKDGDAVDTILARLDQINTAYQIAFAPLSETERQELISWCRDFRPLWRGAPEWDKFASGFQLTKKVDHAALMQAIALSAALADDIQTGGKLYEQLKSEISDLKTTDRVTIGSTGDDDHRVATSLIIDPGGDDKYSFDAETAVSLRSNLIIDLAGDDSYQANKLGIAAGAMSTSILVDADGDDEYRVEQNGIGFALMGFGLLLDQTGNDIYRGSIFSQGVACIGVGLVMDREGNDRYDSGSYSQAIGLPGGCGCIWDSSGDDVYLCTGKHASPYGDQNEFAGWGQGCGFGYRYLGCGGIGLMIDEQGNDLYRAGQFGLGCGYFFGAGLVNDRSGNDIFECSRYGLATAAHYGVGIVLDDQGNDTYSAIRTACVAVIGSSWDLSLGTLVDASGDDVYRGVSYSMGGAAQTSYGFLWDKSGDDVYASSNTAPGPVLGYIGGNSYGAGRLAENLAVFLDESGNDTYQAPGRANNQSGVQSKFGVWIDK